MIPLFKHTHPTSEYTIMIANHYSAVVPTTTIWGYSKCLPNPSNFSDHNTLKLHTAISYPRLCSLHPRPTQSSTFIWNFGNPWETLANYNAEGRVGDRWGEVTNLPGQAWWEIVNQLITSWGTVFNALLYHQADKTRTREVTESFPLSLSFSFLVSRLPHRSGD